MEVIYEKVRARMKLLAIGDIHTKTWIIDKVIEVLDNYDAIIFCGDYVDNWNATATDSINTLRRLKTFVETNPKKVHALIGNHDYSYIHQEIIGRSSGWSLDTYLLLNSPEEELLKKWLFSLPVVCQLDGITFSHAGVTEQWNQKADVSSLWSDTSPIWARPIEFGGYTTYRKIKQVFGHSPSSSIWSPTEDAWCIDTFSEHSDNTPIGDQTVLEIIDGTKFNKIKL